MRPLAAPSGAALALVAATSAAAAALATKWWVETSNRRRRAVEQEALSDAAEAVDVEDAWLDKLNRTAPCMLGLDWKLLTKAEIHALRKLHFCGAQSVSYANSDPLLLVRGEGTYLYDEHGRPYLDTRNNVAHVGHANKAVVKAVTRQLAALNTNTRYLHPNLVRLAQQLLQHCPKPLSRVIFVNSGSEANDLALRLARVHTGNEHVIVGDHAYHGHTVDVINVSPYKFNHKGGPGQRPWVHMVDAPDTYRGKYREGQDPNPGASYAAQVETTCRSITKAGGGVAAFFLESGMSVAGVILPPAGYLARSYAAVREAGGVCVADEVQVGFGRFGSSFWAWQHGNHEGGSTAAAVPDIITMGKPFGNGMALAAVVTTDAIAESFDNGLEYFNTFGGNPVACAAGLAVLEEMQRLDLQASAQRVGRYFREQLAQLAAEPVGRLIGDVRGEGLFLGVDFVRDRESREPATAETSVICSRLKSEHRVLTSVDGPSDNVLVIKPPMVFAEAHVDETLAALRHVLTTLGEVDPHSERTPT